MRSELKRESSEVAYDTDEAISSRHNDAIVVRDPQTRQLILRGASPSFNDCPTCHRPFRSASHDRNRSPQRHSVPSNTFISPEYFRMLHTTHDGTVEQAPPSSPIRRLVEPAFPSPASTGSASDVEFVASTPAPQVGQSIKRDAFSPGYFTKFFIEEKELGRGGKGVVLLVRHELDGVSLGQFACKRVPVGDDHAWLEKVLIEVQLLQGLSHPNLVSYRHVWLEDIKLNRFSPSVPCAFILQQYCNSGDLLRYVVGPAPVATNTKELLKEKMRRKSRGHADHPEMKTQRKLTFEEIYSFFKDVTSGLAHLHAANYIHRDLKPSNCLLHKDGNDFKCLISDFGEVQAENVVRKSTGSTGTISYCAPEVLKQDELGRYGNFTAKSDIFSLGMILYFMCFGRLPYKSADSIQEEFEDVDLLRAEISTWSGFKDERKERPELPNQLYNFLKRLLSINPADRPSASDVLHAIRTEKGLETPTRTRNGSNAGLGSGRIIQSIDSPVPPGTPVNEPSKRISSRAYIEDATNPEPISPSHSPSRQLALEAAYRPPNLSQSSASLKPTISTPLLMPPPSTTASRLRHQVSLYHHYASSWIAVNRQSLQLAVRLAIFAAKAITITKPCEPVATREAIWWPLMGFAAVELALGSRLAWRVLTLFSLIHVLTLVWVTRLGGGGLCIVNRVGLDDNWRWRDET